MTINQRDDLGALTPGDLLAQIDEGQNWGFPACWGQGGAACAGVPDPVAVLDKHAAVGSVAIITGQLGAAVGDLRDRPGVERREGPARRAQQVRLGLQGTVSPFITGMEHPLAARARARRVAAARRLGDRQDLPDRPALSAPSVAVRAIRPGWLPGIRRGFAARALGFASSPDSSRARAALARASSAARGAATWVSPPEPCWASVWPSEGCCVPPRDSAALRLARGGGRGHAFTGLDLADHRSRPCRRRSRNRRRCCRAVSLRCGPRRWRSAS